MKEIVATRFHDTTTDLSTRVQAVQLISEVVIVQMHIHEMHGRVKGLPKVVQEVYRDSTEVCNHLVQWLIP